jgi:putative iron-dependent peroxidase
MSTPQLGIFAMGTTAHLYLEFDRRPGIEVRALATGVADLRDERVTTAGINLVSGFRPELWRDVLPTGAPSTLAGFDHDLVGPDGYVMPATQHDIVLWFSGGSQDVVFDEARRAIRELGPVASVAGETSGWPYHHDRDLTGFVDGTENPNLADAPTVALVPEGRPGAGGSVLLLQKWKHDMASWESLPQTTQEAVIGRTKSDSVEFSPKPPDSHAGKTDQDTFGEVFRRNVAYGTVTDHGTMFVGFCAEQGPLLAMLKSMLGIPSGPRDALTKYTTPLTGAFYFVPAASALVALASPSPSE